MKDRMEEYNSDDIRFTQIVPAQPGYRVLYISVREVNESDQPDEPVHEFEAHGVTKRFIYTHWYTPVACWGVTKIGTVKPLIVCDSSMLELDHPNGKNYPYLFGPEVEDLSEEDLLVELNTLASSDIYAEIQWKKKRAEKKSQR